jgi:hypothetical protein
MQVNNKAWRSAALSLAGLLTAIYLITYSAVPITDDEDLYISAARNIAVQGELRAEQMYGNLRLKGNYHGVEPAHPVLASLWLFVFKNSGFEFGNYHVLYFLPIFYTVLTSVLLLALAKKLQFSLSSGLLIALVYGLGTMAWPYSKSLLREPLLALLVLANWLVFLNIKNSNSFMSLVYKVIFSILVILVVFVKIIYISLWFSFLIMWLIEDARWKMAFKDKGKMLGVLSGVCVLFIYFFLTQHITDANMFYRFSGGIVRDAIIHLVSFPHAYFFNAIVASLLSPFKGLFFYAPFTILGIVSFLLNGRKHCKLFLLPGTLLFALLIFQAFVYDGAWWTPTWGSRFLLPVVAPLLISSLPLVENMLHKGKAELIILFGLFFLGMGIQLPGVLFNSSKFFVLNYDYTYPIFLTTLWDFFQSPYILQWRMVNIQDYDLLIWRVFSRQPVLVLGVFIGASCFCFWSLISIYHDFFSSFGYLKQFYKRLIISSFSLSILFLSLLFLGKYDPYYRDLEFRPLCDFMLQNYRSNDLLIVYSYPSDLWDFFSNTECGQLTWYSLSYNFFANTDSDESKMADKLFQTVVNGNYSRVWIVSQNQPKVFSSFEENWRYSNFVYLQGRGRFDKFVPVYYALYEIR